MLLVELPEFFKSRRDRLMKSHSGATFIFHAHPSLYRNSDVHYPYRQESNFFYLSGFEESDSCLVLSPSSQSGGYQTTLFVQNRDPEKEMWEGARYGIEGAQSVFGADAAYPYEELSKVLPELLVGSDRVFYRLGLHADHDQKFLALFDRFRRNSGRSGSGLLPIQDPNDSLGELRLFKSEEEIVFLRKACQISSRAHKAAMSETRPGMNEGEIEALVDYIFRKEGCQRVGYSSIVAAGKNAACLHYRSNNETMKDGDLLLIDAGGEYQYYSADITRTLPIGRKFSSSQAKAYDLVLKVQKKAIESSRPGMTLPQIHQQICEDMVEGLLAMGLLKGNPKEILKNREYRRFYPHSTSHWLGMDVHDLGLYLKNGDPRPLEPGMVFTIEPGFYVQPSDRDTPEAYHNIGIRIEDDILITKKGCEILTQDAPKERHEIEALRAY